MTPAHGGARGPRRSEARRRPWQVYGEGLFGELQDRL